MDEENSFQVVNEWKLFRDKYMYEENADGDDDGT